MPQPKIYRDDVWEVGVKKPRALATDEDGTVLIQADIAVNIPLKVFDLSAADPDLSIFSTNRTNTVVIFDTLQSWDLNDVGFNFEDSISTNEVTLVGGRTYRVEYLLSHTTDGQLPIVFEWRCKTLLSE